MKKYYLYIIFIFLLISSNYCKAFLLSDTLVAKQRSLRPFICLPDSLPILLDSSISLVTNKPVLNGKSSAIKPILKQKFSSPRVIQNQIQKGDSVLSKPVQKIQKENEKPNRKKSLYQRGARLARIGTLIIAILILICGALLLGYPSIFRGDRWLAIVLWFGLSGFAIFDIGLGMMVLGYYKNEELKRNQNEQN